MSNRIIMRSWREQKILLKRMFSSLSDEDFLYEEERKDDMLERLQKKLGKTRQELDSIFADLQLI